MNKYSVSELRKRGFSLVLAGGSAYGFAHLGVIKFLEENDLKPKEIVGTSMGALIGALYAFGYSYEDLINFAKDTSYLKLLDYSLSKPGLLGADNFYKYLELLFEKNKLCDANVDLKIVATNLNSGNATVFSKKSDVLICDAVRCSVSIPGVFPPFECGGEYFIDGFVSSNLPVEFADLKGVVLAVDVYNFRIFNEVLNNENCKFYNKFKNISKISKRTFDLFVINQTKDKLERFKDVLLVEPNMYGFELYDFFKWKKIRDLGYFEMLEKFEED